MAIANILKLPDGAKIGDFYAKIEKISPPKQVGNNGSTYTVQNMVLSDTSGTLQFTTFSPIPDVNVGKWCIVKGTRKDWSNGDGKVNKTVKGRLRIVDKQPEKESEPPERQRKSLPDTRENSIIRQTCLKAAVALITGLAPVAKTPEELKQLTLDLTEVVTDVAGKFVDSIASEPEPKEVS